MTTIALPNGISFGSYKTKAMKKSLLTLFALTSLLFANAQNNKTEVQIRELEQKEHQAILKGDTAALHIIWAPTFMVNAPFNRVTMSSKEVIDLVKAGVIRYSSFTRNIEQVLIKGDVVITMGSETVVPVGDMPKAGQTINRRYTNIWIKERGNWRLVARHANEIVPQKE